MEHGACAFDGHVARCVVAPAGHNSYSADGRYPCLVGERVRRVGAAAWQDGFVSVEVVSELLWRWQRPVCALSNLQCMHCIPRVHVSTPCSIQLLHLAPAQQDGQGWKGSPDDEWIQTTTGFSTDWMEPYIREVFHYFTERTPRSFVECRETSMVWNYRHADVEFGRLQARDLLQVGQGGTEQGAMGIVHGCCV